MRTTSIGAYGPLDRITYTQDMNHRLYDVNTSLLSSSIDTNVSVIKPDIVTTMLEPNITIKATDRYVPTTVAITVINPYETKALMRFAASVSYDGLSSKANTNIDISASLNFVRNNSYG